MRGRTAQQVLAYCPRLEDLGTAVPVDATGTRRRLQALSALGWSQAQLAARLGMLPSNFGRVMSRSKVQAGTETAVRALYDEIWDQAPRQDDHRSRIAVSRACRHAAAAGWLPPQAWDDEAIDDPTHTPEVIGTQYVADEVLVERALARGDARELTEPDRAEVVHRLQTRGLGASAIAHRTKLGPGVVARLLRVLDAQTAVA